MDVFARTVCIYLFLLVILRLAGKRTLSEMSTFDFVLVLIISEATQNALVDDDRSLTTGLAAILTLVALDRLVAVMKTRFPRMDKFIDGTPLMLVDHGRVLEDRMKRSNVSVDDVLQSARQHQGVGRLDQIKYAVLESSGGISVIPMDEHADLERRIEKAVEAAVERALREHAQRA
jgi:uncharacterized membrane protein YcaP (DUF421 family)